MKHKKILLIFVLLVIVLSGCSLNSNKNATQNNKDEEFSLKQECYKYKDNLTKNIEKFNNEQKLEKREDNDGSFSYCEETQKLKEIFYSNKLNSCAYVVTETTLCQTDQNTAFNVSYEYQNLYNTLTNEKVESFRTISRSAPFENANEVQAKIERHKN